MLIPAIENLGEVLEMGRLISGCLVLGAQCGEKDGVPLHVEYDFVPVYHMQVD